MSQSIPLTSDPAQRFEIIINDIRFFFSVYYSANGGKWFFDLENSTETLIERVAMLRGQNMLDGHPDLQDQIGQLWMWDAAQNGNDAGPDNLGTDFLMINFANDESPL
jgi:hypothetical protein